VTVLAWRKSSYSGDNGGACVEVGTTGPAVAVRDSTHRDGPQLSFAASTWQALPLLSDPMSYGHDRLIWSFSQVCL
jgi:hypothetical protein